MSILQNHRNDYTKFNHSLAEGFSFNADQLLSGLVSYFLTNSWKVELPNKILIIIKTVLKL